MFARERITDSWLVRRTLAGRRECFSKLVERHIDSVYAVALARTRNHADAEDIVQDAFVQAYTNLNKLREPGKFCGWVTTIARNSAARLLVRKKRESNSLDMRTMTPEPKSPDPAQSELHAILRNQLNELDEDAREVLLMHYFAGYSAREIAVRLEISRDAALKRLQRSREKLAGAVLEKLEGSLEDRRRDVNKRAIRITSALAGVMAPWSTRKAAAAFAVRPVVLVVSSVAGIALLSAFAWRNTAEPRTPFEIPVKVTASEEVVAQPQPLLAPSTVTEIVAPLPAVASVEVVAPPTLDGLWTLHQPKDSRWPAGHDWPAAATVELTQRENEITMVKVLPVSAGDRPAQGTVVDGQIVFPLLEVFAIMVGVSPNAEQFAEIPTITGIVHPASTRIRVEGTLPAYREPSNTPAMAFAVVMNKLKDGEAIKERVLQQHVTTAQQIRDAILAYAYDHQGRLPDALTDLVPRYIDDVSTVSDDERRSLIYNSDAIDLTTAVWANFDWASYRTDLSTKERIIEWEQERAAAYGEQFLHSTGLLTVRGSTTEVQVRAGFHGEPEIVDPSRITLGQPGATVDVVRSARAQADACMHRLKEAALGIVQFWGTTDEQYNPAGWRSLVPEFLEDPTLLTCPSHTSGTLSYAMTFPAMSRSELTAVYAVLNGIDPEAVSQQEVGEGIPIAIETIPHVIDGREFRAALFLDGHIGMFHDRDWAQYVEPYISYSVQQ